jgi:IS5 family transposase
METYLRLMYLKHRYGLGYETLVKEVADSLSWRRFCRIGLGASVPHPTTLMKLTRRFGPGIVEQLNEALLKAAVEQRVLRSRRVRVDTTVMEADVRYPTDSGLCAQPISRVTRAARRVKAVGLAARSRFRDRRRAAGKVIRNVSHSLGRSRGRAAIDRLTGEVHRLAKTTLEEARHVLSNAQRGLRRRPRPGQAWVARLADEIERAERVIKQTTRRLAGERVIPDRVISLADTDTLGPALEGAQATGMRVRTVLADRGCGNEVADEILTSHGISDKVVPRVGTAAPVERTRAWRRRYRFRAGAEGRISHLKRRHGLSRTRLKGHTGATIWAGYGVLAHNLDRMVALS